MTKPVCLIIGAGAGIGGHVAKRVRIGLFIRVIMSCGLNTILSEI